MKLIFKILLLTFIISFTNYSKSDTLVIAFWNVENLFDTYDDPQKNDEDFTPSGTNEWTEERLEKKQFNLARVIRLMNENRGPDILGVCEVENEAVLRQMVDKFLPDLNYGIAYVESPDRRGIDNGLLYKKDKFTLIEVTSDTIQLNYDGATRPVVGAVLVTKDKDTLYCYVNHWPSRRGGEEVSEPNRISAALTLRNRVNEIFEKSNSAKIIIMGDFNDMPNNKSVLEALEANPFYCDSIDLPEYSLSEMFEEDLTGKLFNTSYPKFAAGEGTYLFRGNWNMLDQIIIAHSFITDENFYYLCNSFEIFKPEFIVTKTGSYAGAILPTYGGGSRYIGGYSDHFPVKTKFILKK